MLPRLPHVPATLGFSFRNVQQYHRSYGEVIECEGLQCLHNGDIRCPSVYPLHPSQGILRYLPFEGVPSIVFIEQRCPHIDIVSHLGSLRQRIVASLLQCWPCNLHTPATHLPKDRAAHW